MSESTFGKTQGLLHHGFVKHPSVWFVAHLRDVLAFLIQMHPGVHGEKNAGVWQLVERNQHTPGVVSGWGSKQKGIRLLLRQRREKLAAVAAVAEG